MNHSGEASTALLPLDNKNQKTSNDDLLFPLRLYKMLEYVEDHNNSSYSLAMKWLPHGRAFVIKDKELLLKELIPRFFGGTKTVYTLRMFFGCLHRWGFKR